MTKSVTSFLGVETFHGFRLINNADSLFASAFNQDCVVDAAKNGTKYADLTVDLGTMSFVMVRTLPDGTHSIHRLAVAATSPERLQAHWEGFVMSALADHNQRAA